MPMGASGSCAGGDDGLYAGGGGLRGALCAFDCLGAAAGLHHQCKDTTNCMPAPLAGDKHSIQALGTAPSCHHLGLVTCSWLVKLVEQLVQQPIASSV